MTSVKSANAVPTLQQSSVPNLVVTGQKPSIMGSRSSLDVPRTDSPWEASDEAKASPRSVSPLSKLSPKPIARLQEPAVTSRQRPLSLGRYSPPPKPPVKPKSRNPSPSKLVRQADQAPTPGKIPLTPQRIPFGGTSLSSAQALKLTELEKPLVNKEAGPVANVPPSIADHGIRKDISIPSPNNRTEKPKPPSKPPMIHGFQGKLCQEPGLMESAGKRCPPSDPLGSALDDRGIGSLRKPVELKESSSQGDHVPSSTKTQFNKEPTSGIKYSFDSGFRKPPRSADSNVENPNHGQRPGLPPRPTQGVPLGMATKRSEDDRKQKPTNDEPTKSQFFSSATQPLITDVTPPSRIINLQNSENLSASQSTLPNPEFLVLCPANRLTTDWNNEQSINDNQIRRGESPNGQTSVSDYPDTSRSNRRPPRAHKCASAIETKYDTRLFDACGRYICATGYLTRAWDVTTGELVFHHAHNEKETKVTSIAFKSGGAAEDEGKRVWLGTNYGELYEVDIPNQEIVQRKPGAHAHREIIKLYRYENYMWSLDDDGRFHVWPPDDTGSPNLTNSPQVQHLPKGHTFSIVVNGHLWLATGKDIRIYNPSRITEPLFQVTQSAISQSGVGEITSGAVISSQIDRVYFGHADGKVTLYSTRDHTCIGVLNVSAYKINCMAGAGFYLWAGFNTGMIYVYDTRSQPWLVKKDWLAHENPVSGMIIDRTTVWKFNRLHVVSMGMDNIVRIWDGLLEDDWLGRSQTFLRTEPWLTAPRNRIAGQ